MPFPPEVIARLIAEAQALEDPEARAAALFRIQFDTNPFFQAAVLDHIERTKAAARPRVPLPTLRNTAPLARLVRVLDRRVRREVNAGREPLWTLKVVYAYIYAAYHRGDSAQTLLYAGMPLMNWLSGSPRHMPVGKEGRLAFIRTATTRLREYAAQQQKV